MPFFRVQYLILLLIFSSTLIFSSIKVSPYDVNSAIRSANDGDSIKRYNVIATSENKKLDVLGFWFVNSGLSYSDDVVVMRVAFNNFLFDSADGSIAVKDINMLADVPSELLGDPLFYPNPFRFTNNNTATGVAGGVLQYQLSKPMAIEIQMYDIFGRRIWSKQCAANSECGRAQINKITFNKEALNGYELSSGVYFYIFIFEGKVIGRGKVAVVP
tara:strand:- start:2947 stop:3594 length:648 start_codon:yes stop_codon:yes gene_type:complete